MARALLFVVLVALAAHLWGRGAALGVAAALLLAGAVARAVRRLRADGLRVLEHGADLKGWVVRAAPSAQLLISFPGRDGATDEQLAELAARAAKLDRGRLEDPDEARVAELLRDEARGRAALPGGFTGGGRVYLVRAELPGGRAARPWVQCKALDDAALPVLVVPYPRD